MKKILLLTSFLLFAFGLTAQAQEKSQQEVIEESTIAKKGSVAPVFSVEMIDGTSVDLAQLKGKVVLVNFWATWCPPCREEFKRVQKDVIDRFANEDFIFLPISRGETESKVKAFLDKNGYTFPVGLDKDESIFKLYATNYIPRNFVIGKDGKIALVEVGYESDAFDHMLKVISELLKK